MKKLLTVAILALTLTAFAQEDKKEIRKERPQFTLEQERELQIKKMTLELDLTAQQQKEISKIISEKQTKRQSIKKEIETKKADNKLTTDDKFVSKRNILDAQIAYRDELKKVLTPEQMEKWQKMSKENMRKRKFNDQRKGEHKK
ncbi:hypothetical protein [Flavobacterium sp.]|uniref:hypothetical protein n=1 Tax=Flavobacterium sp. TaxID=239 RepID=UPI00260B07F2|nr:hypothetical protein [Flavobacterium sp.]MDD3005316.1 hypothetical protein [Flavobacterium sp.]